MRWLLLVVAACGSNDPVVAPDSAVPDDVAVPVPDGPPPDGGALSPKIVFVAGGDIHVMDPDGSNDQNLTNTVGVSEDQPAWSPDKTKIAFHSNADDDGEIYVMNADGSNVVRLTVELGENDAEPAWSPDGTRIAFASRRDHVISSIYVMNADGSDVVRVTNAPPASDDWPAWSPDGAKLAFSTNEAVNLHIAIVDVAGTNRTRVTPNTESAQMPAWSPDGTQIAFSLVGAAAQIFAIAPDGTGQHQITAASNQAEEHPAWSRDGSRLVFDRNIGGQTHVLSIGADGTGELDLAGPAGAPTDPAF